MSKNIQNLARLAFALIVIVVGNYVIVAQTVLTGDWQAESDKILNKIQPAEKQKDAKSKFASFCF